jgi:hypothetical protein
MELVDVVIIRYERGMSPSLLSPDRFLLYLPLHPMAKGIYGLLHEKQRVGIGRIDLDPFLSL